MLAIRLKRVGRKGMPIYRIAVQEAQRHPSSGRVVAYVGTYNPHTKEATVQKDDAEKYLSNGAQPTPRVIKLLKDGGVKLPTWVKEPAADNKKTTKNAEKLRKNRPDEPKDETTTEETPVEEAPTAEETPSEEAPAEETAAESEVSEAPAEEVKE